MQIITSKVLPPLAPGIIKRYVQLNRSGEGKVRLEAKYCPAIDLIATYTTFATTSESDNNSHAADGTADQQDEYSGEEDDDTMFVDVWRFNGQQVFSIKIEPDGYDAARVEVVAVDWRDDGQMMAILSSDSVLRLVNSFSGKVVHKFSSISSLPVKISPKSLFNKTKSSQQSQSPGEGPPLGKPSTVAYSTLFTAPSSIYKQLETANLESGTELDDLLGLNVDIERLLKTQADLPRELASIDVEAFLPRLACLPPPGFGAEDLFSTRNSVDSMFHSSRGNLKNGMIDLVLVGGDDYKVHLRIFDSFEIGDIDLSAAAGLPKDITVQKAVNIATHPFSDYAYVIAEGARDKKAASLNLLQLDLKFISQSPTTLPVLVTKASHLQNILRYLKQIQTLLARELKTALELPARFLRPLNEDLVSQDGESASFSTVAYHTLVTGEATGVFRDWLVEVLGDRGVKRWEKAVGDCLELVRRLISENWGPAIERSATIVSRLAGFAGSNIQGNGETRSLGIEKNLVKELQQTIDVMAICGEDVLCEVDRELTGFNSFIKWLKWEVEAAGLEDTSERLDEMRESNDHTDIPKVLDYIDHGLVEDALKKSIGDINSGTTVVDHTRLNFYNHFKEERRKAGGRAQSPTLGDLLSRLNEQCQRLFQQIAVTLRQKVLVSYVTNIPLESGEEVFDVRIVAQPEYRVPQLHLLGSDKDQHKVTYITIATQERTSRASTTKPVGKSLTPDDGCEIIDAKFVDDVSFLVLVRTGNDMRIYSHDLPGVTHASATWHLRHTFEQGMMSSGMRPGRLVINGRKHRRAVAVVDHDGKGYSVFDLDTGEVQEGDAMMIE